MAGVGIDDRDGFDAIAHPETVDHFFGHDTGPVAGLNMGKQCDHGITFQCRTDLGPGGIKVLVDDPAILHVRRQQTQGQLGCFVPGDVFAIPEIIKI